MSGTSTLANELSEIRRAVQRLCPDWHDPRRFYDRRDEIADRLSRIAQQTAKETRK